MAEAPLLASFVPRLATGAQLAVSLAGERHLECAGREGEEQPELSSETRFDLASLTKIVTAMSFMRLVEDGRVDLDTLVSAVLPTALGGRDTSVTWRHLLAHTSGLPAMVDLRGCDDPAEARSAVLAVRPERPPGRMVYSDVGFMVLGLGLERIASADLSTFVRDVVTGPLGISTAYGPILDGPVAETEQCAWRGRRLRGEVHDEAASVLGGSAGHAGLFGTATELVALGESLLGHGTPVLRPRTIGLMRAEQSAAGAHRRGLGFSLWSPASSSPSHPLGRSSFGHSGFTGCSLWVDPALSLVIVLLTNAVYRGRDLDHFEAARLALHAQIYQMWGSH